MAACNTHGNARLASVRKTLASCRVDEIAGWATPFTRRPRDARDMAQMHRSHVASIRRRALVYGAMLAAASASMPPGAPMPGAPMPPPGAQLGPEFYVREASGLLHGPYPQPPSVPAGYEVVELAPHAQRAEEV